MFNNSLFRRKSLTKILEEGGDGAHGEDKLAKSLKLRDLVSMGIAAVIGAGIFSTIGSAAYNGGPGVVFLFIIAAVTCGFTALCYAEFASRVPVAGSAYTYSYVTFGELTAWIIGWALILEYAIGNIVVAISWSSYFNNLLRGIGIHLPAWMVTDGGTAHIVYETALKDGKPLAELAWATAPTIGNWHVIFNLPAFVIVVLVTMLVYIGIKESKKWANAMVVFKLVVLLVVILAGCFYVNTENWNPFMPNGFKGVMMGVSAVFYAYIGFDAISTTAEECENPQRDLPRGMIYALLICTGVYVLTALVITGMVNYKEFLGVADPLAYIFEKKDLPLLNYAISISAVVATTSVLLVFQIGQPRIWMSMSRDGLLPKAFSKVHPTFKTPSFATIVTGFLVAIPSLFMDAALMTDLTSIGTLFAFVLVCGGVLLLPTEDKKIGKFKLPYINGQFIIPAVFLGFLYIFQERIISAFSNIADQPHQEYLLLIFLAIATVLTIYTLLKKWSFIPVMGVLFCTYLMIEIPVKSWMVFFGWMALGLTIYFLYSRNNSKLAAE
jgi:basic amino acid/polyamine antiporter, APA family